MFPWALSNQGNPALVLAAVLIHPIPNDLLVNHLGLDGLRLRLRLRLGCLGWTMPRETPAYIPTPFLVKAYPGLHHRLAVQTELKNKACEVSPSARPANPGLVHSAALENSSTSVRWHSLSRPLCTRDLQSASLRYSQSLVHGDHSSARWVRADMSTNL